MKEFKSVFMFGLFMLSLVSCADKKNTGKKNKHNSDKVKSDVEKTYAIFDENNNLLRPKGYRSWVFAGTSSTPKSQDPDVLFPDFQNVYVDPVSFAHWKKHGEWREGTIIVKELLRTGDTNSPVGHGYFQGAHFEVAAMVKDSMRFPDMHDGWNYFGYADFKKNVLTAKATPLGNQCAPCHVQNAADGAVFYQYYPVIQAAKGYGDGNPENEDTRPGLVPDYKYNGLVTEYMKKLKEAK
jgi:hypothetical protein